MQNIKFILFAFLTLCFTRSMAQNPADLSHQIFPVGDKIQDVNFTGTVWVKPLLAADSAFHASIGNVVFEPKARSKWHKHPGGQTLIGLDGLGYYQEKGKPLQVLRKGDVVRCPPDVEHWHGASRDQWFVQLAITPEHPRGRVIWLREVTEEEYQMGDTQPLEAQNNFNDLEKRHQHIVTISSFTAKGDLEQLKQALSDGLDAGMTVNEIKEVLVHLYAYAGFPRSLNALNTFLAVLKERKEKGINDPIGKEASPLPEDKTRRQLGTEIQTRLVGRPVTGEVYDFAPVIDQFLKEHLFGDIFGRDVLDFKTREIATIAALASLGGAENQLRSHFNVGLNTGLTEAQLKGIVSVLQAKVGYTEGNTADAVLQLVLNQR